MVKTITYTKQIKYLANNNHCKWGKRNVNENKCVLNISMLLKDPLKHPHTTYLAKLWNRTVNLQNREKDQQVSKDRPV